MSEISAFIICLNAFFFPDPLNILNCLGINQWGQLLEWFLSHMSEWHYIQFNWACLSNRHQWEVRCGAGWRLPWHMEHRPFRSWVHQLERYVSQRKEVHSQKNIRQQSRTGQSQFLQVCLQCSLLGKGRKIGCKNQELNAKLFSVWNKIHMV